MQFTISDNYKTSIQAKHDMNQQLYVEDLLSVPKGKIDPLAQNTGTKQFSHCSI